jgi:exodeoxyribonuclease VII small subunit
MSQGDSSNKQPADAPTATEWSFEQALKRLEELVRRLEQGNAPLEQSLTEYAEAVELLRVCQGKLDDAQGRIEVLSGFDSNGQPIVRPLSSEASTTLEEKRSARSSRRSANPEPRGARRTSDVDEPGQLF